VFEACLAGESRDPCAIVFVGVLGVNQLSSRKLDFEIELLNTHALRKQTLDVDLDPSGRFVVKSAMLESAQVKRAAQLAIDSRQHV
jgi:hypothetical protein